MGAPNVKRAAEVLRNYAAMIEESEVHHSGPLRGRCTPEIEKEVAEYRSLADALIAPSQSEACVQVPIATLEKWGEALSPYTIEGSYNNDGVIDTIAEMATFVTKRRVPSENPAIDRRDRDDTAMGGGSR
jgi:hypothetical protein